MKVLEQDAEALATETGEGIFVQSRELMPVDVDCAAGRLFETGENHEKRGLAATRWTDNRHHFGWIDRKTDILEDVQLFLARHQVKIGIHRLDQRRIRRRCRHVRFRLSMAPVRNSDNPNSAAIAVWVRHCHLIKL